MSIEKHVAEFVKALNGNRGMLDAWLECNNESECRAAILGAIEAEREACAKECESLFDAEDDSCNEAEQCAAAIRMRSSAV